MMLEDLTTVGCICETLGYSTTMIGYIHSSRVYCFSRSRQRSSLTSLVIDSTACTYKHHRHTKHIDVKYHWIREAVEDGVIEFKYISTEDMAADGLTKPLCAVKFNRFLRMLGMLEGGKLNV